MSRVERVDRPTDRRPSDLRRTAAPRTNRRTDSPGSTPGKAEGEVRDVEEALKRQQE
jgi:hypothetical protein